MTAPETAAELALRMEVLAAALIGNKPSSRTRTQLRFGAKGSLAIEIAGTKRGAWFDHEAGAGGDALDLVRHLRGGELSDALRWASVWLGNPSPPESAPHRAPTVHVHDAVDDDSRKREMARCIWIESVPARGSIVEKYLASRGLLLPRSDALRFHPQCPCGKDRLPAMVAQMTNPVTGEPSGGVHRTFLAQDGGGKAPIDRAKAMLGPAGVIRLSTDEDVTYGLGLAEGIETALSVMQTAGWSPVWAAGSAGAIAKFPVLNGIEALTIFADTGTAGIKAAEDCGERWTGQGREVRIIYPRFGSDWNDVSRGVAAI
jgi:hypothetical protein